jgi:hypothetical protein
MMWRVETPEPPSRPRTLRPLLAFVVGFSVLSWLVTGGFSQIFPSPTTTPSPIARTSLPPLPTLPDSALNGVTCAAAGDCWAVGFSASSTVANQPLFEHYTGSSWTTVRNPSSSPGYLNAVTCVSASDCWAVGFSGGVGEGPPLIEHYTGSRWTIVSTLNPKPGLIPSPSVLTGVTCVSTGDCWAVGISGISGNASQLIEHFTGSVWTIVPNPGRQPHPSRGQLNGVACTSVGDCWAVGVTDISGIPLFEHYTGNSWSDSNTFNPSADQGLNAVTCTSAGGCWAVGPARATGDNPPLFEHDTGSGWAVSSTPSPRTGGLSGVTCASAADCWAVGSTFSIQGAPPLIEHYSRNSWAVVSTPNPSPGYLNALNAVTCASAADCWAVGFSGGVGNNQPLIEHYAGSSWAIVSTLNPN